MIRFIIGLLIAAALQFGVLVSTIAGRIDLLTNGTQMILKALPVDPRDLFRGDYVILKYDISTITAATLELPKDLKVGQKIWVEMAPSKTNPLAPWHAVSVHSKYDPTLKGQLIKGTLLSQRKHTKNWKRCKTSSCGSIRISYGIKKYFLPEGTGKELEKARNAKNLSVLIAVGDDGTAAIRGLNKNGTLLYEEPLF
ncbi:MAG: GDYXXLXY domain-containing protein [Parvibaculaceae bacterium]|nr:GDYXXLXY domain-containing protein [Parvibaculaceae bacterium]